MQDVDATGGAKTLALLTLQATAEAIVSAALASADEVAAAIEDLEAFTAAPDSIISGPRILQIWGPAMNSSLACTGHARVKPAPTQPRPCCRGRRRTAASR